MQKLKKVFSPGNDKDDEMMYGTPRKSADNSHSQSDTVGRSSSGSATNQSPTSPSQTKEHGTTRQVISPDADKYDEQRFGKSASGTEPQSSKAANDREALLASQSAQEDKSVKRQVLHPESNKHDETGFGTTGFTGKDAQDTKAPSSRPNELGSVPPSNDRYTSETTAAPGSAFTTDRQAMPPTTDSRMSMKSGVVGSADQRTTDRALGSDGITDDGTSAPKQDQSSSNFSRNAALAGAGAAAGAGGAYAATRQRRTSRTSGDPEIEEATYTDRSFPLRGGTNSSHLQEDRPASSVYSNDAAGPSSTSAYIDPSTSSSTQKDAGGLGYGSGSAAVAGAGAGAVGAAATKEKLADHSKHSHVFHGDPCKDGPHSPADKTLPYVPGPHNTVAANLEDPHVPGEFPSEDGTDPHGNHGAGGFSRSSQQQQQTPLLASTRPNVGSQSSYPMQTSPSEKSSNDHHTALAAGGAGAAGLGAYAATRDRGKPIEQTTSRDVASSTQQPQTSSAAHTQTPQQVAGDPVTGAREPEKEHQYGRNAAYAGGAGAAGAAAYTAYQRSQDRDGAVPSSQDPVSRDSNVGGLGDTQRRDVTDSTAPKDEKEHHYGRNAGLAGATGAAGYGAYQYGKDRGDNNVSSKADDPYDTYRDAADPKTQPETTRHAAPTETRTAAPTKTEQYTTQQPQSQPQKQVSPQQEEHHYGRNAALAGGAGAAGAAGYSALQSDRGDTGPASKTIGPHESNVANILDPRVRPEPEKMKDHTTAGPWQSDTLNKLDPKVESNPEKADVKAHGYASGVAPQSMSQQQQQRAAPGEEDKDHHYGRNAALAGGAAGAGAAAGYGASQAYEQRTQPEGLSEKEQEKLAKQQEKQAQHDAKQRAHEQEKQAKHDAKEQQKQAKHEADEAAKAQKKEQEKAAKEAEKEREKKAKEVEKEQKKAEKQHAKEEEKAEKARAKEAERAEKEHAKEQEKLDKERESEDSALAAARQEEAERKHHEHNKLHKTPPEEREKKGGILHRIFHHKAHDREGVEGGERQSGSFEEGERAGGLEGDETGRATGAAALDGSGGAGGDSLGELRQGDKVGEGFGQQGGSRDSGIVTEKSTGLPMNVGKYGSGAGGTDAGEHIHGYQGEAR